MAGAKRAGGYQQQQDRKTAVIDIITTNSLHAHLAVSQPDILLQPQLGSIGLFDFHRWEEAIAVGRAAVQAVEEELRSVAVGSKQ